MQVRVLKRNGLRLSQGVAVLLLAGISAGCSSARFGGTDDFMTASTTPNQREIIRPSGDTTGAQPAGNYDNQGYIGSQAAPASGGVTRSELAPPTGASAPQPTQTASIPLAETSGGTMAQQQASVNGNGAGTRVTVQAGDTVYGLARRYGVPADTIMRANGMSPSDNLRSGSKILIPGASSEIATQTAALAPTKATETAKTVAAGTYKVQEGDTLSRIASRTGASVSAIKQANGLSDEAIRIGQTLKIPGSGGSVQVASAAPATPTKTDAATAPTKTASAPAAPKQPEKSEQVAAYTPPKKTEKVIDEASETAPDATGIGRMRWPVRGRVISQFGKGGGKTSDGIDISVPEGTSVKAAENGVVIYAGDGLKEFGNTVLVRHEDGLVTVYGHASALKVQRGDKVKRGQEIAVSGMSGQTDAPKLHFEVRKNSAPVDPSTYLE
ncbi:LysM peptidoglycan-binding domain-containing protein [Mesorhizobium sp. VNQ89]|uniref:LysM peptidoglycan-binding domain-containing protein n=1 Tax=Mesorhizobium quangtriensis TaxID=3157709 RepID=UPI0032B76D9B